MVDDYLIKFVLFSKWGLSIASVTIASAPASINIRVLVLTKINGSYYDFIENFYVPAMKMVTGQEVAKLHQTVCNEL